MFKNWATEAWAKSTWPRNLSLDRKVALSRAVQGNQDIRLIDASRGVLKRFTFGADANHAPVWSRDGSRIAFYSEQKDRPGGIYQKASSIAGIEELLGGFSLEEPSSWSPDGRFLLFSHHNDPKAPQESLWVLPLFGDRKPVRFSNTSFTEYWGQFSPDGRWIAYASDESGIYEVYVQPFPEPGGKWQISAGGGIEPRWRSDGKGLFYIAPNGKLMAGAIQSSGQTMEAGAPVNAAYFLRDRARRAPWSAAACCRLRFFAGYTHASEGASKLAHSKGFASVQKVCGIRRPGGVVSDTHRGGR